jgi:hypothetical protein
MIKTTTNKIKSNLAEILKDDFEITDMPAFKIAKDITAFKIGKSSDAVFLRITSFNDENEHFATKTLQRLLEVNGYLISKEPIYKRIIARYDLVATKVDFTFIFDIKIESQNRKKFKRLKESRLNKAIKSIQLLGNLADKTNYNYGYSDIEKLSETLIKEVESTILKFKISKRSNASNEDIYHRVIRSKTKAVDSQLEKEIQFREIENISKEQKEMKEKQEELIKEIRLLSQKLHRNLRETEDNK